MWLLPCFLSEAPENIQLVKTTVRHQRIVTWSVKVLNLPSGSKPFLSNASRPEIRKVQVVEYRFLYDGKKEVKSWAAPLPVCIP